MCFPLIEWVIKVVVLEKIGVVSGNGCGKPLSFDFGSTPGSGELEGGEVLSKA